MRVLFLCFSLLMYGCAHNDTVIMTDKKIGFPKEIALDAPRLPWVVEIEKRLRQEGFSVLRWASQRRVREKVTASTTEEFQESSTRYVLFINGHAPLGTIHRCFGGGYNFDYLTAELIDTKTNETLVSVSGSGYSEGCPPMSGSLFKNISDAVSNSWR